LGSIDKPPSWRLLANRCSTTTTTALSPPKALYSKGLTIWLLSVRIGNRIALPSIAPKGQKQSDPEIMSGTRAERPILGKLLENLRTGDVLVVWKLDRLGRSLKHLIEVVNELMTRKIGLKSLNGGEDTKRNSMHAKRQSSLETTHVIEATIGHLTVKVFSALSRRRSGI
jgi:hypothetical protein